MKSKTTKLMRIIILLLVIFFLFFIIEIFKKIDKKNLESINGEIVYARLGEIYKYDVRHKDSKIIFKTYRTGQYATYPTWLNRNILFTIQDSAFANRYIVAIDDKGTHRRVVLKTNENAEMPAISFDMKKIAFLMGSWSEQRGRIVYKLYTSNANGTRIKKISDINLYSYKPSWSPDSKKIAFTGFENVDWRKDQKKITREGMTAMGLSIYIVDIETGITNKIVDSGVGPAWSPDGDYIAFYKPVPFSDRLDFTLFNLKNHHISELIKNKIFEGSPQWTADGKFILYQRYGLILLPPEKSIIEAYSLEQNKSFKLLETPNKILGFSLRFEEGVGSRGKEIEEIGGRP